MKERLNGLDRARAAATLAKRSYLAYVVLVHHGKWIPGKLHKFLCGAVQDFVERPTTAPYEVLVLSVPPQHGKSMAITETLPSWYLGRYPDKRVIEVSYNDDFAGKFGRRNLAKIREFGSWVFGLKLGMKSTEREFELDGHRGGMISRGVMSGITGNPGDLIIIDDPIKSRLEADSAVYRERLKEEWINSIRTRAQAGSKVILIQTRWHEEDLAGYMLKNEPWVTHINIPCEAEEDDPLGRLPGEALCPELGKGQEWLLGYKSTYLTTDGARAWNALFQGRPAAQEGNLLKRDWWKFYRELPELQYMLISVDASFKDREENDFVAIQVWGKFGADCYLVYAIKKHLGFPETVREVIRISNLYNAHNAILIEDKANGTAVIQTLQEMIPGIIPVEPIGGKISRVNSVAPMIESGNVYLPENEAFAGDFIEECASFPNGAHDDQVDCMSQALAKLRQIHFELPAEIEPLLFKELDPDRVRRDPVGQGEEFHVI